MGINRRSLVLAILTGLVSVSAWAESSEQDIIVRYRGPQNHDSEGIKKTLKRARSAKIRKDPELRIINSEEGLVRLRFTSREEAAEVLKVLDGADEIMSVAPNLLYRPQLSLEMKEQMAEFAEEETLEDTFLRAPFAGAGGADVTPSTNPAVNLAPLHITAGTDPLAMQDWALQKIDLPTVESLGVNSATKTGIITAVIDTGIDYNHEDLSGALWRSPQDPRVIGYDFAHDTTQPYDNVHFDVAGCMKNKVCKTGQNDSQFLVNPGHGTHCAGHVGAVANNSVGIRGVGAGTQIMGLKFFYDYGEMNAGQGDDTASIRSIDYAIANGVKVISASWGGRVPRFQAERSEMKQALLRAQQAGIIFVVAAGNDSTDQDNDPNPSYPAAYNLDNMIVVAATDQNDVMANFSGYGAKSVHIAAPGVKIFSTVAGNKYGDVVARFKGPKGKITEMDWDGTSMATPIVAGAVALVWSKHPDEPYQKIRARILNSARPVAGLKTATGGVLDVAAALKQ